MGVSVLLVGATGAVGRLALKRLLSDPDISAVQVLTRTALPEKHPKITEVLTDFSNLSAIRLQPVDVFLCALGTTIKQAGSPEQFYRVDKDFVELSAKLAFDSGARKAGIVSCVGASPSAKGLYLRTKGEMEQALLAMPWASISFLQPSLLLGHRDQFRLGERLAALIAPALNWLLVGPLSIYKAIQIEQVAGALASIAKNDELSTSVGTSHTRYLRYSQLIDAH